MAIVTDYASLVQAVTDHVHRSDLASSNYINYFIQQAQEQINKDVFDKNFGNGIKLMEGTYGPYSMAGGVVQTPLDWLAPKLLKVADGSGQNFTLNFKAAAWIYDRYPMRQADRLPSFIARELQPACSFTGVIATNQLTVSAFVAGGVPLGVGSLIDDVPGLVAFNTIITALGTGTGGNGTYTVNNSQTVGSESMTGGGNVFVFGPFPDSSYSVSGTYYQKAALLTGSATTNWMVLNCPDLLLAACMRKAGRFLKDPTTLSMWKEEYDEGIEELVSADKAERWAASTMQADVG